MAMEEMVGGPHQATSPGQPPSIPDLPGAIMPPADLEIMARYMAELGMTPVSRSRVTAKSRVGPKPWEFTGRPADRYGHDDGDDDLTVREIPVVRKDGRAGDDSASYASSVLRRVLFYLPNRVNALPSKP